MAQRFKAKTLISNSGVFSNELTAPNLIYNTGNQNISGVKNFYSRPTINGTGIVLSGEAADLPTTIVYQTGDQTISGQKRFADEDIYIPFSSPSLNQPSTFLGGHSGPGVYHFVSRQDYRPYVFPNPQHYYSGLNTSPHVEIYYNTGTSRWWFTYNNILQDASPIVSPSQTARLPLTNWSGGNMRIYPIYSHNISHYTDGKDPIDPNLIRAVALTGNQTISGIKDFINNQNFSGNINVSGTGIFNALDLNNIDNLSLSGIDIIITSGSVSLTNRPTVNGTGVLLSGEAAQVDLSSTVRTTGNQTISGIKTFANPIYGTTTSGLNLIGSTSSSIGGSITISGGNGTTIAGGSIDLVGGTGAVASGAVNIRGNSINLYTSSADFQNSPITNVSTSFIISTNNFTINSAYGSDIVLANSASQITGTISSGLANGFNVSIHQIGTGQVVITGAGTGITINSYGGQYKTAGQYAAISLLHTGNNGYLMYGNTAL